MKSLKIVLWITAIACLTAIPFIFFPWAVIERIVSWFGIDSIPDIAIAIYFFKVVFGIFGLIGVFFILLAMNPFKYEAMLNLGAFGLVLYGLLALIFGFSLGLPTIVYLGDGISGLVLGVAILIFSLKSKKTLKTA